MSNIIDFIAYKITKRIMSPEKYAEVVQCAMKKKDIWLDQPLADANVIIAKAYKGIL